MPAPAVARDANGQRWYFVRGVDGALWARQSSGSWFSLGGIITSGPAAARAPSGEISVVARGADGATWLIRQNGETWSDWVSLGGRS